MNGQAPAGYTMPDVSPLYPELPYLYRRYRKLTVVAQTDLPRLRLLLPAPLEVADNRFEVFFMDAPDVDGLRPYQEAGVVIAARYRGKVGGHVAFEYVTTDDSLCAGREIWGYPKKLAQVELRDLVGGQVTGYCARGGDLLAEATFTPAEEAVEGPTMHPRLQVKRIPPASSMAVMSAEIVWNQLTQVINESISWGSATLRLGDALGDALTTLEPFSVIGASVVVGSFVLGHGEVIGRVDAAPGVA